MWQVEHATAWTATSIIGASLAWRLSNFASRDKHLPPGPPTIPILGNAHQLPSSKVYIQLKKWSDEYGPVFSLKLGQMTMIVLNSRRAEYELMDKKGLLAADRPMDTHMELAFGEQVITMMHNTEVWKAERKLTEYMLSPRRLDGELAAGVQHAEVVVLLKDLLDRPEDFFKSVKRASASIGTIMYFGQRAKAWDSFWTQAGFRTMRKSADAVELGTYIPQEAFLILALIPERFYRSQTRAKRSFEILTEIWTEARCIVDERRDRGDVRDCIIDAMLDDEIQPDAPMDDQLVNNFVGSLQMATADTTGHTLLTHIMYLAKHPHVQQKARKELDLVCGTERLPCWTDFDQLPYINCIVKEGNRIHPNVPLAPPHTVTGDHWYDGMLIPDGCWILVSPWALHYSGFKNPATYDPDRFQGHPRTAADYASSHDYEGRDHHSYGSGRRICAGIHLAERIQWRVVAAILWAFELRELEGEKIDVEAFSDGVVHEPMPFKVEFVPRSEKHAHVIYKELESANLLLGKWA